MSDLNYVIASDLNIWIDTLKNVSKALEQCLGKAGLLLLEQECGPEFFDLKTRLAGELFQKFINYQVAIALVIPEPSRYGERFVELALEHTNHSQIRFVKSSQAAKEFLNSR